MNFAESGRGGVFGHNPHNIEAGEDPEQIRDFFTQFVYGSMPKEIPEVRYEVLEERPHLDSQTGEVIGIQAQTRIIFSREGKKASVLLLVVIPLGAGSFPVIVSLNMYGNHSTTFNDSVIPSKVLSRIVYGLREKFLPNHRGAKRGRVNVDRTVKSGKAIATAYYGDFYQDVPDGEKGGLLSLYPDFLRHRREDNPGAISVWASGMSRIADYLERLPSIDSKKMFAVGHSRLGKALNPLELHDDRFAGFVPVAAGKGGTAPSSRISGEPLRFMRHRFPHWFSRNFDLIVRNPHSAPHDQDALLRITSRKKMVVAGKRDWWTDSVGQADAVRRANEFRVQRGHAPIEFHEHDGGHEMDPELWGDILDFVDRSAPTAR
jgi:hypothetical protein